MTYISDNSRIFDSSAFGSYKTELVPVSDTLNWHVNAYYKHSHGEYETLFSSVTEQPCHNFIYNLLLLLGLEVRTIHLGRLTEDSMTGDDPVNKAVRASTDMRKYLLDSIVTYQNFWGDRGSILEIQNKFKSQFDSIDTVLNLHR